MPGSWTYDWGPEYRDVKEVERIFCENPNIIYESRSGRSLIMLAAACGHLDIVKFIVGIDKTTVNQKNWESKTALMYAARRGDLEIVQFLAVVDKSTLSLKEDVGTTILMTAAYHCHFEVVKFIVGFEKATLIQVNTRNGFTALTYAAISGSLEIVKFIVGVDVTMLTQKDDKGKTCLMHAAMNDHPEIVEFILGLDKTVDAVRATLSKEDYQGRTVLMNAVRHNSLKSVQLIVGLDKITLNKVDNEGNTALMHAGTKFDFSTVAKFLIENGSNVMAQNESGDTALHLVIQRFDIRESGMTKEWKQNLINLFLKFPDYWPRDCKNKKGIDPTQLTFDILVREMYRSDKFIFRILGSCLAFLRAGAILRLHEFQFTRRNYSESFHESPVKFQMLHCFVSVAIELRRKSSLNLKEFVRDGLNLEIEGSVAQFLKNVVFEIMRQQFPRSLQAMCRNVVLQKLPLGLITREQAISMIQLPKKLKNYLNFEDLEEQLSDLNRHFMMLSWKNDEFN